MFNSRMTRRSLQFWATALAAWVVLLPFPAHASWLDSLPVASPGLTSERVRDQLMVPTPEISSRVEPEPNTPLAVYLPDLRTLPPFDFHLQDLPGGWRFLRLANTIWNSGQGPLELISEVNTDESRVLVYQHIFTENGQQRKNLVGEFVRHPTHDHWHFNQFTLYELWSLQPDHSLGNVVASSDKLSYCMMDTDVVQREHPQFDALRGYVGCNQRRQGLSVGWGDTYNSYLDGQTLDLTDLADGFYALVSTVNPDGAVLEENYRNNSAQVYLQLSGKRITQVTLKEIKMAGCEAFLCE